MKKKILVIVVVVIVAFAAIDFTIEKIREKNDEEITQLNQISETTNCPVESNYSWTTEDTNHNGYFGNKSSGDCLTCNGSGKCHICNGAGSSPCSGMYCNGGLCSVCNGTGLYDHGTYFSDCLTCGGDGRCNSCNGTQKSICTICNGDGKCNSCNGKGR